MRRKLLLLCALLLLPPGAMAQSAQLQPQQVYRGDIALLVIEYVNKIPSLYALDTSVLEQDFEVIDVKARTSRVVLSDQFTNRMQWQVQLLPRRSGRLAIPSLDLGGRPTPRLWLEVLPLPAEVAAAQEVSVRIDASPRDPYVGQQIQISSQLLHNTSVIGGHWSEPQVEDARIYRSGNESSFTRLRDGRQINVSERKFALFVESSGMVTVPPVHYRGQIPVPSLDRGPYADIPLRRIYRSSDSLQLQLRPVPEGFGGAYWLPAQGLQITQRWGTTEGLRVGDTLDRVVSISARGLPASALPVDLVAGDSENYKVYPDQAKLTNRFDDDDLVGSLEQSFAVILTSGGEIKIPALRLKWWDLARDAARETVLEGVTLAVTSTAAAGGPAPAAGMADTLDAKSRPDALVKLSLLLVLGILYAGYLHYGRRLAAGLESVAANRRIRAQLRRACLRNDAPAARRELIGWARQRWRDRNINGLRGISDNAAGPRLAAELRRLDAAIYSDRAQAWEGERLWRQIVARGENHAAESPAELPRLYPQGETT